MSVLKFSFVMIMLLSLASHFSVSLASAEVGESEASLALSNAEEAVFSAYHAVLMAEESGANVSSLLVQLNEAGWFLTRARMAYKSGDFNSTLEFASQSQEKLNGFVADADALRETAIYEHYLDFMVNVVGSIVGSVAVVCGSVVVWVLLKRRYAKAGSMV